ncbi:MAG: prepilin-type N-terminal cleavage/methylation domain-containing protein [Candidatus Pacebacteria bacterium]|nr:prepilin-type N-terminal cleavage/methylation domain-containing protein [Candidatus Paceibacterota bacterium]MCK5591871.1 prepilin-type N-terminal cleavage/methylation domain-containing protein [Candidatus Paceibacterota bacterium]
MNTLTSHISYKKGFTLVELLVTITIVLVLLAISVSAFINTREVRALEKEVDTVAHLLEETRSLTLASKNDTYYGVNIDTTNNTVTIIIAGDTNNIYREVVLDNYVTISEINSASPTTNFERLTGKVSVSGDIIISLTSDPTQTKTIILHPTGLVDVQ